MNSPQSLADLNLETEYRTGEVDLIESFYIPCLHQSKTYDRAVGYFRSSILHMTGRAFVTFALRGGKIRLVCSPELTEADIETIEAGYAAREAVVTGCLGRDLDSLESQGSAAGSARILATLIAHSVMDMRIAIRPLQRGMFHEKIGLFCDSRGNIVSFKGSSNESFAGWHSAGNFESNEVFCSWRGGLEKDRVIRHQEYFERLWDGRAPGIEVMPLPDAIHHRLMRIASESVEDLDAELQGDSASNRRPMPHQLAALAAWEAQESRGILEHATGSGKTFTALIALQKHLRKGLPALVLVPSRLLLEQWRYEIKTELPGARVLSAGAGYGDHIDPYALASFTDSDVALGARVVLATMQTARAVSFSNRVIGGAHLLLIADEVHQLGSLENSKCMEIETGPRLGLSATPRRYGDPAGTKKLVDYFGPVVQPPFTLADAIKAGRLVPYEYRPMRVMLADDEVEQWAVITAQLGIALSRSGSEALEQSPFADPRIRMLLIRRARILKKAEAKTPLAVRVLRSEYREGQRWLVYCEDKDQLSAVVIGLRNIGLNPLEYHTAMEGASMETLQYFRSAGGIMVAIACLDEGIDIPEVSHALILASSQNPRQFIQRRGRVLRTAPGKTNAHVYDTITLPPLDSIEKIGLRILQTELRRAWEFATGARNVSSKYVIRDIAADYGVDLEEIIEVGYEEDME